MLTACSQGEGAGETMNSEDQEIEDIDKEAFINLNTDFSSNTFEDPSHLDILKELNICTMVSQDSIITAECSPENFRIFPFRKDKELKDAFILLMKAGIVLKDQTMPLNERTVIVFERENGELVKVNGFRGNVISAKEGKEGVNDLILNFYHPSDQVFFDCYFRWDGIRYSFEEALALSFDGENYRPIKKSIQDSLSGEIYTSLMEANLIF